MGRRFQLPESGGRAGDIVTTSELDSNENDDPNVKIAAYKSESKVRIGYMRDSWAHHA